MGAEVSSAPGLKAILPTCPYWKFRSDPTSPALYVVDHREDSMVAPTTRHPITFAFPVSAATLRGAWHHEPARAMKFRTTGDVSPRRQARARRVIRGWPAIGR